jgi:hypothetical protein
MACDRGSERLGQVVASLALAAGIAAIPVSADQGGASPTADARIAVVKAYNPKTGQPTIGTNPATGAGDNLVLECSSIVAVPSGYPTFQLTYPKSWKNELWVDGKLENQWTESTKPLVYKEEVVVRKHVYTYVSPTKFVPGPHTVKCLLNTNNGLPERTSDKGNNTGSATFTVVKVLRSQPKWPGH